MDAIPGVGISVAGCGKARRSAAGRRVRAPQGSPQLHRVERTGLCAQPIRGGSDARHHQRSCRRQPMSSLLGRPSIKRLYLFINSISKIHDVSIQKHNAIYEEVRSFATPTAACTAATSRDSAALVRHVQADGAPYRERAVSRAKFPLFFNSLGIVDGQLFTRKELPALGVPRIAEFPDTPHGLIRQELSFGCTSLHHSLLGTFFPRE